LARCLFSFRSLPPPTIPSVPLFFRSNCLRPWDLCFFLSLFFFARMPALCLHPSDEKWLTLVSNSLASHTHLLFQFACRFVIESLMVRSPPSNVSSLYPWAVNGLPNGRTDHSFAGRPSTPISLTSPSPFFLGLCFFFQKK